MIELDPKTIVVMINNALIHGFAPDTMIRIEHASDAVKMFVGVDGEAAFAVAKDRTATITLILLPGSVGNLILDEMLAAQVGEEGGEAPLFVEDPLTQTIHIAERVRVQRAPAKTYGRGEPIEWALACLDLQTEYGVSPTAVIPRSNAS